MESRPYADVLIIGGGINGLATFRDLALQGVDVALVERSDFVSGASSASSHMIHGGIRYLENGEFRLVHEAVDRAQRAAADRTALRAARCRRRSRSSRPSPGSSARRCGSSAMASASHTRARCRADQDRARDLRLVLARRRAGAAPRVPRAAPLARAAARAQQAVKYTATYWDASLHDPERLALDVLRDGRAAGGDRASAANYTAAVGVDRGRVVLRDAETGVETPFAASVVINASGPWTDLTNLALGDPTRHMGGTKGSHIVLDHPELLAATGGRELFFENEDGRIVLIYPLKGRVLVGTTDLEHDMRDPIVCTEAEVDYFIDLVRHVLPEVEVDRAQIVYRFAGVRPLPGHGDIAPGLRLARVPHRRRAAGRAATPPSSASSAASGRPSGPRPSTSPTARSPCSPQPRRQLDEGRRDRRRTRIPDHRARPAELDRSALRGPARRPRRDAARSVRHGRR